MFRIFRLFQPLQTESSRETYHQDPPSIHWPGLNTVVSTDGDDDDEEVENDCDNISESDDA